MSSPVAQATRTRLDALTPVLNEVTAMLLAMQSGDLDIQTKSNAMDLVTRADRESEQRLVSFVRAHFPDDAIAAEEGGSHGDATAAEFAWAIDPVDGTVNYAHGLPLFAVSIGILHYGQPCAGLVALPALGSSYRAIPGEGASKDGRPIRVSPESQLGRSLVVTGFPYNRAQRMDRLLAGVRGTLSNARGLRRTGSAALDLCWVAEGRFGALYELNLNAWDSAAGAALVQEAGGRMSDLRGDTYDPFGHTVVASNGQLHQQLLDMLRDVDFGAEP